MTRIILTYGLISGLVVITGIMASIFLSGGAPHSDAWVGYLIMLVALSSILVAVKQLYRRIDIENIALAQKRHDALIDMALQPFQAFLLIDRFQSAAHRVLADDPLHAEQFGQHAVAAQRGDMRVALMARQHCQHDRAQHVANLRRIRASVEQRAVRDPGLEAARDL